MRKAPRPPNKSIYLSPVSRRCSRCRLHSEASRTILGIFLLVALPPLASAQTGPRRSQVTPIPPIPDRPLAFSPITQSDRPDLLIPSSSSANSDSPNGILIPSPQAGSRIFGRPITYLYAQNSENSRDDLSHLIRLNGGTSHFVFLNEVREAPSGTSFVPTIVSMDRPGTDAPRTAITSPQASPWLPADLDADGSEDFLQCLELPSGQTELRIWDRAADGSYTFVAMPLQNPVSFTHAMPLDLDGDGDRDLYLFTEGSSSGHTALERTGSRSFAENPHALPLDSTSLLRDLDGDGRPDSISITGDLITWRMNMGDFTFSPPQQESLPTKGLSLYLFLTTSPGSPTTLQILRHTETATWLTEMEFGTSQILDEVALDSSSIPNFQSHSKPVAIIDLDGDGRKDLLFHCQQLYRSGALPTAGRLAVSWRTPSGFTPITFTHPAPLQTEILVAGDFNGDGRKDLIIGPDDQENIAFLPNRTAGASPHLPFGDPILLPELAPPPGAPADTYLSAVLVDQLSGDSNPDLLIQYTCPVPGEGYRTSHAIAVGIGNGHFNPPVHPVDAFDEVTPRMNMDHLVDWDKDGDLDLIASGKWFVREGATFTTATPLVAGAIATDGFGQNIEILQTAVGDVNGDGAPDLVSLVSRVDTPPSTASYSTLALNNGSGGILETIEFRTDLAATDAFGNPIVRQLVLADLNHDGWLDLHDNSHSLSDPDSTTPSTQWRQNPGNGTMDLQTWQVHTILNNPIPPNAPFLDFDGDRAPEWISPRALLKPSPTGPTLSSIPDASIVFPGLPHLPALTADFDEDGDADFIHAENLHLTLFRNPQVDESNRITLRLIQAGVIPSLASPSQDADGDGNSNLTEAFFGTDPLTADRIPTNPFNMALSFDNPASCLVSFQVPTSASADGIHYRLQQSSDLTSWHNLETSETSMANPPLTPPWILHHHTRPVESGPSFFRVEAWQAFPSPVEE